ncbi:hypothetical protein [Leifsonia sp. A12D58]|uniref:hypothetical protein n=1 Tax=Leifsonia sp. A12D58 TaxID=3397674 RepID=UPI0039DFFC8E
MRRTNWFARSGLLVAVALSIAVTACSSPGDLSISNESDTDVTVSIGDDEVSISAWGAASILGSGCSEGDITVEFAAGDTVVVAGPVCPDQRIMIHDDWVDLQPS